MMMIKSITANDYLTDAQKEIVRLREHGTAVEIWRMAFTSETMSTEDKVIAINGLRQSAMEIIAIIQRLPCGDNAVLEVARRNGLTQIVDMILLSEESQS